MKTRVLQTIILAALGLILGWGIAQTFPDAASASVSVTAPAIHDRKISPAPISMISEVTNQSVAGLRAMVESPFVDERSAWLRWAAHDPPSCYAALCQKKTWVYQGQAHTTYSGSKGPDDVMKVLFTTWVERDAEAAFAALVAMPKIFEADLAVPKMLDVLVAQNPLSAVKFIKEYGDKGELNAAEIKWGNTDLSELAIVSTELGHGIYRDNFLSQLAKAYAAQNPQSALDWVRGLHRPNHDDLMANVFDTWSARDPQQLMEFLTHSHDPAERLAAARPLAVRLGEQPPEAAWQAAAGAGVLSEMYRPLVRSWAARAPEAALEFILQAEPKYQAAGITEVFEMWRGKAPKAAAAAALLLPQGETRATVMRGLIFPWAEADPEAAAAFVSAEPPSSSSYHFVEGVISNWRTKDPASAAAWLLTLPTSTQGKRVEEHFYFWADKDAAGARTAAGAITKPTARAQALAGLKRAGK